LAQLRVETCQLGAEFPSLLYDGDLREDVMEKAEASVSTTKQDFLHALPMATESGIFVGGFTAAYNAISHDAPAAGDTNNCHGGNCVVGCGSHPK
jgi:hypothetical protein